MAGATKLYYVMSAERGCTTFLSFKGLLEWMLTRTLRRSVQQKKIDRVQVPCPGRRGRQAGYKWVPVYETCLSGEVFWFTSSWEWMEANGAAAVISQDEWKK